MFTQTKVYIVYAYYVQTSEKNISDVMYAIYIIRISKLFHCDMQLSK